MSRLAAVAGLLAAGPFPAFAAPGLFCRLTARTWVGCAADAAQAGAPCRCADAGGGEVAGSVGPAIEEQVVGVGTESAKTKFGLGDLSGPVTVFVPDALIARRERAATADEKRLVEVWDDAHPSLEAVIAGLRPPPGAEAYAARGIRPGQAAATPAPPAPPTPPAPPAPPTTAPEPTTAPAPTSAQDATTASSRVGQLLFPVRAFTIGKNIPSPGLGAYGVVALKAKPTPATTARLVMLCQSFLASLPTQSSLPHSVPLSEEMVTFWPIEPGTDPVACPDVLSHYDLWAGLSAIHDAIAQGNDLSGQGPFLIGWSPSESRQRPDAVVLVVDMSRFNEQASFDEAFLFWQQRVVQDPSLWRSGFSVERVRLAMRDFADHYGSDILKAVHLGGD